MRSHDLSGQSDELDRVVARDTKDPNAAAVTLVLARGFTNGEPIAYKSGDAFADGRAGRFRMVHVRTALEEASRRPSGFDTIALRVTWRRRRRLSR